ncbi:MAG: metallopeptidase family protein [Acidobacteriota bacterium]
MDRERFEKLVEEALAGLPKKFRRHLRNLAVMVEENAPRRCSSRAFSGTLLGLYHGVPLKDRGSFYGNVPPDVIVIYQRPIEQICFSDEEIKKRVGEVVLHEIGHYFGLSEKELREIED